MEEVFPSENIRKSPDPLESMHSSSSCSDNGKLPDYEYVFEILPVPKTSVLLRSIHIGQETYHALNFSSVPNAFSGELDLTQTRGFISGVASRASVRFSGNGCYYVEVDIGSVTFCGLSTPLPGKALILTSSYDMNSIVSFRYDQQNVSGIYDARSFLGSLMAMLGLFPNQIRSEFFSQSTWSDDVKKGRIALTCSDPRASGYSWALTYKKPNKNTPGTFDITNRFVSFRVCIFPSKEVTQTLALPNGFSIVLSQFDATRDHPQEIWQISSPQKQGQDLTFFMD